MGGCAIFADVDLKKVIIARSRSADSCFRTMTRLKNYAGNSLESTNRKYDYRLEPAINSSLACLLLQTISGLMVTHNLEQFKKLLGWLLINVIYKKTTCLCNAVAEDTERRAKN